MSIWILMSAIEPLLKPENLAEIQALLQDNHMAQLYTLTPPSQP